MGFWSAVLLPLLLCLLVFVGFFNKSDHMINHPGMMLWVEFSVILLAVMGSLILPMLIVFIAYSVNSIEHKADTWKTLFSLPIPKLSVYSAKYFYAFFLIFLCLSLFVLFTLGFGNLLGALKPALKFSDYNAAGLLTKVYFKLFLSSLGILSIQFLLSLLFRDFLKPMGIGFICTITGAILAGNDWKYAYLFPYSHPMLAIKTMEEGLKNNHASNNAMPEIIVNIFTQEIWISLMVASVIFIAGYFIVLKKSVK
jgi:lantibiotic transport system permease protein